MLEVPQELFAAMEEQRAACEAIIASKDTLITGAQEAGVSESLSQVDLS
jgi:hypothetical protein